MAGTELFPDAPFDPNNPLNILIKLTPSDTWITSNTLPIPQELLQANVFPFVPSKHLKGLLKKNEPTTMEVYDFDAKIATFLIMRKANNGIINFNGWGTILHRRVFKAGDTIAFWWDSAHSRLNFKRLPPSV